MSSASMSNKKTLSHTPEGPRSEGLTSVGVVVVVNPNRIVLTESKHLLDENFETLEFAGLSPEERKSAKAL